MKALAKLVSETIKIIRKGIDQFIEIGDKLGIESLKQLKTQRELARVARVRNEFEEQALKQKEEMQSLLRQQAKEEYDGDVNRRIVNKITFEQQQKFWSKQQEFFKVLTKDKKNLTDEDRKQLKLQSMQSAAYVFAKENFVKITDEAKNTNNALKRSEWHKQKA